METGSDDNMQVGALLNEDGANRSILVIRSDLFA